MELKAGIKGYAEIVVDEEKTAGHMGSGLLNVYATPCMVALMEYTCQTSVNECLEEGQGTVGTALNIKHLSATPVGLKVWCESELVEVDRRRLEFEVKAYDEAGLIGEGTHQRFIIDNEKFMSKTLSKLNKDTE